MPVTTTYLTIHALEQLDHAQAAVDRHLVTRMDGRCMACGHAEPCPARIAATTTFARYGRLPVRSPGLAMRGLAQTGRFGWFTDTTAVTDGA
jgi:hypothetical protein